MSKLNLETEVGLKSQSDDKVIWVSERGNDKVLIRKEKEKTDLTLLAYLGILTLVSFLK